MKFDKPAALNSNTHRHLRFRPTGHFGFAGGLNSAPICTSEFLVAAREYAIVFVRAANKVVCPMVVLGLKPDENLFVSDKGAWSGRYLPAALRSYPFAFIESANHNSLSIVIDEAYPGFGDEDCAALFSDSGDPAPQLSGKLDFLRAYQRDIAATRRFAAELDRLHLLTERSAQFTLDDGSKIGLTGFAVVDDARLRTLPDADLLPLARSGALLLVTAHQLSLSNLSLLVPRLHHPPDTATQTKAQVHAKD